MTNRLHLSLRFSFRLSNIGTPGHWMFRVGQIGDLDDVQLPDLATGDS